MKKAQQMFYLGPIVVTDVQSRVQFHSVIQAPQKWPWLNDVINVLLISGIGQLLLVPLGSQPQIDMLTVEILVSIYCDMCSAVNVLNLTSFSEASTGLSKQTGLSVECHFWIVFTFKRKPDWCLYKWQKMLNSNKTTQRYIE